MIYPLLFYNVSFIVYKPNEYTLIPLSFNCLINFSFYFQVLSMLEMPLWGYLYNTCLVYWIELVNWYRDFDWWVNQTLVVLECQTEELLGEGYFKTLGVVAGSQARKAVSQAWPANLLPSENINMEKDQKHEGTERDITDGLVIQQRDWAESCVYKLRV